MRRARVNVAQNEKKKKRKRKNKVILKMRAYPFIAELTAAEYNVEATFGVFAVRTQHDRHSRQQNDAEKNQGIFFIIIVSHTECALRLRLYITIT